MADLEHLGLLKQGMEVWNRWRSEHLDITPDFSEADLQGLNLFEADLRGANLREANLGRARLDRANLTEADLVKSNLSGASLIGTILDRADLEFAFLVSANLVSTGLEAARLCKSDLKQAHLQRADLMGADLTDAKVGWGTFGNVDLSVVQGLERVNHAGPSTIGIDTGYRSGGKIPEAFLRGAGVPDEFIIQVRSLGGEYYSCFISYSSRDQDFADRLYEDLRASGVRCWFTSEDMKIGDKIWDRLDQSIRLHEKLLLVLSASSISSEWVEDEVTTAFEEERQRGKTVLFPVRLDETVFDTKESWVAKVRQRHIGDFRAWKERDAYQKTFDRLLRDLKAGELRS